MVKNIVIGVLVIIVVVEAWYIMKQKIPPSTVSTSIMTPIRATGGSRPLIVGKGDNLLASPLAQYAYKIAPGDIPASSAGKLIGFSVKSTTRGDGSLLITLAPKDSDDQFQQYVLKKGQLLYFIEMTPSDDQKDNDADKNYRDDYGIVADVNGVIQ